MTSTIREGAVLSAAVPWQASVKADATDSVSRVEFSIDGQVRWIENNEPFVFDNDGQVLPPWLLGNGPHVLSVHAFAGSGAEGTASAHVTVRTETSENAPLTGTYRRTVTAADGKRVLSYRTAANGAFGDPVIPGAWTIKINATGVIDSRALDEPDNIFKEPFTAGGVHIKVYGPAVWLEPNPSKPDLFCEPEQPSDYVWRRSGATLTLTPVQKVCADRDTVLVGSWTRIGA